MPKQLTVTRTALGLQSQYNQANLPEGALLEAQNVDITREGVISKTRGFSRYGNILGTTASKLLEFDSKILVHQGTTLSYDADGAGNWTDYSGTFSAPDATVKIRSIEVNGVLLLTTSDGVYRTDGITQTPVRAGIPGGIAPTLAKSGTGLGWFVGNTAVGYCVVWGRVDDQDNLLLGASSFRESLTNTKNTGLSYAVSGTSPTWTITVTHAAHGYADNDWVVAENGTDPDVDGTHQIAYIDTGSYSYTVTVDPGAGGTVDIYKDFDVTFTAQIPDDIVEGDFYEVYRTELTAAAATNPGEKFYKMYRGGVTTADLAAGTVTFSDVWDDSFLGVELYTNANREGATQQNARPPYAKDIALWKGYTWYANTKKPEFILLQLVSIADIVDDTDTVSWTLGVTTRTYTFSTAENQGTNKFQRFTTGTDSENYRNTAKSLVKIINGDTGNTLLYAYYASRDDDPPGYIVLEARRPNTSAFSVTASAGLPSGTFSPQLPTSGTEVSSSADAGPNRVYHSKLQEPEAVPDFNYEEIGGRANIVRRILPLRDSLICLCTEGVWRISGEDEVTFVYKELDPSVRVRAPEAAVVLNNSVYCLSTQGVVRITESGTGIVSRAIEEELKDLFDEANYETLTHAVGYESERKYMLFTPLGTTRTCYMYNYLTRAWTTRLKNTSCAHVLSGDDKLYLGHSADYWVLEERKNFYAQSDYADESVTVTVDSVSSGTYLGAPVTLMRFTWDLAANSDVPAAGWQFYQGGPATYANAVVMVDLTGSGTSRQYEATLDRVVGWSPSTATASYSIPSRVRWAPETLGTVGTLKQFQYAQVYLESLSTAFTVVPWRYTLGFSSDVSSTEETTDPYDLTTLAAGATLRSMVPRNCQISRALNLTFEHNRSSERFDIVNVAYTGRVMSDRTAMASP